MLGSTRETTRRASQHTATLLGSYLSVQPHLKLPGGQERPSRPPHSAESRARPGPVLQARTAPETPVSQHGGGGAEGRKRGEEGGQRPGRGPGSRPRSRRPSAPLHRHPRGSPEAEVLAGRAVHPGKWSPPESAVRNAKPLRGGKAADWLTLP